MTTRTDEEIIESIKNILDVYVEPAVAQHGGQVNFVSYNNGKVLLELSGACSGCAGSTMTLKFGIENMLKEMVEEVEEVAGMDDPFTTVSPYYTDHMGYAQWETIELDNISDLDNK